MAFGKIISQLASAGPLSGNESIPIFQDGETKEITVSKLVTIKTINTILPESDGDLQLHANDIPTDNSNFDNILSPSDNTVQKALDTLDHAVNTASSGANWGGIAGNITNQTDLQNSLNEKLGTTYSSHTHSQYLTTAAQSVHTHSQYLTTGYTSHTHSQYLTTAVDISHGHSVVVSGNILATSGSVISLSVPNQTVQPVAVSVSNGAFNFSTLNFANQNGISFGSSIVGGSNVVTASYTVPVQTVQSGSINAVGNVTGTASSSYQMSELILRGAGNVSLGNSAGSVVISATQSVQTQGTFALNNTSGNVSLSVGSNLTWATQASSIVIGLDPNYSSHDHSQYLNTSNSYLSNDYTSHTHSQYLNTSVSGNFVATANSSLFQQTSNMSLYAAVSVIDGGTP